MSFPSHRHRPAAAAPLPTPAVDNSREMLERILETPYLAQAIPRLQPQLLHRIIQRVGLEDCGALVALVTPAQLSAVFDLDLWRSARPGGEEQFDANRFGVWLEVLLESGAESAASTLAAVDPGVVTTAFAQFVRVYDPATLATIVDGEIVDAELDAELTRAIGGYLVTATRGESWDAMVEILIALDAVHGAFFHRVMHGCRDLSNAGRELDGLDDLLQAGDQALFDRAGERDRRREQQGYLAPAQARAFLAMARTLPLGIGMAPPSVDPIAAAYLRDAAPIGDEDVAVSDRESAVRDDGMGSDAGGGASRAADAALIGTLIDGGVLPQQVKGLLGGAHNSLTRLGLIQRQMTIVAELDAAASTSRQTELVFLANALVAGCSLQARAFTPEEAADTAVAVCNLGLEQWPTHWLPRAPGTSVPAAATTLPDDFLVEHDLVGVFQVGWTILHEQVCLLAARELIAILKELRCTDADVQRGLNALRRDLAKELKAGTPWRASEALEVLISLDMPAWAALAGLIAECPTAHAALTASGRGMRSVKADDFAFFSESSQLASVRDFMTMLPERLRT